MSASAEFRRSSSAAWQRLGEHLGFTSTRPEKLYGTGPDNLWALSGDRHAVTELKTGCTTGTIVRKDLDQLDGSVRWDQEQHPGVDVLAVMVHPGRALGPKALAVLGMRVITPQKLSDLKTAVVAYAVALGSGPGPLEGRAGRRGPAHPAPAHRRSPVPDVRRGPHHSGSVTQ